MIAPPSIDRSRRELELTGAFYRSDAVEVARVAALLAPHLADYFEIVLAEQSFEAISGGSSRRTALSLADAARRAPHPLPEDAIDAFLACDARFPDRALGIKVPIAGAGEPASTPSLYCRVAAPRDEVLVWLGTLLPIDELLPRLESTRVIYGLGFYAEAGGLAIKTYTLADLEGGTGFVSHRVSARGCGAMHKEYRPELPLHDTPAHVARLARFACEVLHADRANHLGWTMGAKERVYKLYLERVGAIPTDSSLR